jgi:hypothetical protein
MSLLENAGSTLQISTGGNTAVLFGAGWPSEMPGMAMLITEGLAYAMVGNPSPLSASR